MKTCQHCDYAVGNDPDHSEGDAYPICRRKP
jgi:hypothetical protein